ncbi:hypothetical protein HK101_010638 [Irineochytrium annulatum]|nr:hypothetical protein HK101_010638 [Irineochytrium annulatum]
MNREEELRLIDRYFAGSWAVPLVVVHKVTFLNALDEQLPMLRLGVCCMGALIDSNDEEADMKEATRYFEKARNLASSCFEEPSLDVLQALIVLSACAERLGNFSAAWRLMGMSARQLEFLSVDVDPDELDTEEGRNMTWVERETRRRCWWVAYVTDKMVASITNMPPQQKFSFVKSPCSNVLWGLTDIDLATQLYNNPAIDSSQHAYSYFARLVYLFGQSTEVAKCQLTLGPDTSASVASKVNDMLVRLQAELDDYLATLPDTIRRKCASNEAFGSPLTDPDAPGGLFLAAYYHACHCIIHSHRTLKLAAMSPTELADLPVEERRRLERSFKIGRTSTEVIARKLELSLRSGADGGRQPQFASFPLFECGLFLVILSSWSSPTGSKPDAAYNFNCRRWLAMILRTLRLLARTWRTSVYVGKSLEALMQCVPGTQPPTHLVANDAYLNTVYGDGAMEDKSSKIATMLSPPPEILLAANTPPACSPDPVTVARAMLAELPAGGHDWRVVQRWLMRAHGIAAALGGGPILLPDAELAETMTRMSVSASPSTINPALYGSASSEDGGVLAAGAADEFLWSSPGGLGAPFGVEDLAALELEGASMDELLALMTAGSSKANDVGRDQSNII